MRLFGSLVAEQVPEAENSENRHKRHRKDKRMFLLIINNHFSSTCLLQPGTQMTLTSKCLSVPVLAQNLLLKSALFFCSVRSTPFDREHRLIRSI